MKNIYLIEKSETVKMKKKSSKVTIKVYLQNHERKKQNIFASIVT